jgi:hypothetical protein
MDKTILSEIYSQPSGLVTDNLVMSNDVPSAGSSITTSTSQNLIEKIIDGILSLKSKAEDSEDD